MATKVYGKLTKGREIWWWEVYCPYCGRRHLHGDGPVEGQPQGGLRLADCGRGQYDLIVLTEAQRRSLAKEVEADRREWLRSAG